MTISILIIEDAADIRECLMEYFAAAGCRTITAENGEQGLQYLSRNEDIDVVILDLQMPVVDGYQFLEGKLKIAKDIPVIVFSGEHDIARLVGYAGVRVALPKTTELTDLMFHVRRFK